MLRTMGFLTGCGLTAVLALTLFDQGALDGLRPSVTIPPEGRAQVAAPQTRAPAADVPERAVLATDLPAAADASHGARNRPARSPTLTPEDATGPGSGTMGAGSPPMADPYRATPPQTASRPADSPPAGTNPDDTNPDGTNRDGTDSGVATAVTAAATWASAGGADDRTAPGGSGPDGPGSDGPGSDGPGSDGPGSDGRIGDAFRGHTSAAAPGVEPGEPVAAESVPLAPSAGQAPFAEGTTAWHAFWTPFRSEASAAGFARHLEKVTGLEYRVVKAGPGVYRVAFRHEGDEERTRRLLAIERASGLKLRHGEL